MERIPLRIKAFLSAALLCSQLGCAHRSVRVSAAARDEVIPCRGYQNSLEERPPGSRAWLLAPLVASVGALVGAVAVGGASCREYACMGNALGALMLGGAGVGGLVATGVSAVATTDPRPAQATRCEAQLVRVCAGLEDDGSCRSALDQACRGGDGEACWALDASLFVPLRPRPPVPPLPPAGTLDRSACGSGPYPSPLCQDRP